MKIFFFLIFNLAYGASAIIRNIYHDRMEASVYVMDKKNLYKKNMLVAKFLGGNTCHLEVIETFKNLALISLKFCSMKKFIFMGQKLGDDLTIDADVDFAPLIEDQGYLVAKENFWSPPLPISYPALNGFSVFILYSFAHQMNFLGTTTNTATQAKNSINGTISSSGAAGFGLDYLKAQVSDFGWSLNGSLETPRNFYQIELSSLQGTSSGTISNTSLILGALALNLNYSFPHYWIPYAGVNISLPILSNGDLTLNSAMGFQIGISKEIVNKLNVDLEYRWIKFRGGAQLGDQTIPFSWDQFDGTLVRLKYLY